ncbi:MAG TPA: hypothetical protein ENJ08_14500, partial [Gammaproteobacteria bacterium]|nr:hypothetical protein [Gammaproteobacteria bacterium]
MSVKNNIIAIFILLIFSFLSACSGGGGGSTPPPDTTNPPPTTVNKSTFTGIIKQSSGNSLPGATITLEGTSQTAITDSNGIFTLPDTLPGNYVVDIDGTTATGDAGTAFGILKIAATVGTEATTSLNQVITLPDLNNALTARASVTVDAGNIVGGISAANGTILLGSGGLDVAMQIDGTNVQGSIDVSATPVPLSELPMALPASAGANAGSFVTIQPPTATFDPALDLTIPNDQGLPPGTLVDIYSFDHDLNDWVNRSAESGNQGVVSADGTLIEAKNVISKGGWNGPLVIPDYIETVTGFVMNGSVPLQGVLVFTSSGQQGITAADGSFSMLVPVSGVSIDVSITATSSAFNGAVSTTTASLPTADDGSSLDFGVIDLAIPTTGILSGVALQNGLPSTQSVTIIGDTINEILTPDANGAFTLSALPAGAYTASTTFSADTQATTTSFNIVTGLVTVITLQNAPGNGGANTISVRVSLVDDNFANPVPANDSDRQVTVTLSQGNTAITQTTDINGLATFNNITGMVTVTGQLDIVSAQLTTRIAATLHDITPINGQIGLPVLQFNLTPALPVQGTAITGTISNIPPVPAGFELIVIAKEQNTSDCCDDFNNPSVIIPASSINNGTASYTLDNSNSSGTGIIAGNYTVMAVIRQVDFNTGITLYDSAAVRPTRISTTDGTTSNNANLNFADITMKYEFTTKSITVNNLLPLPSGAGLDFAEIDSTALLASGEELGFETFAAPAGSTVSFPSSASFISASPGGTRISYDLDIEYIDTTNFLVSQGQGESQAASSATALTFNLINTPVISSPTNGQVLSLAAANSMTATWNDPGSIDLVFAVISSFNTTPGAGDINTLWIHYLPGSNSSLTIPSTSANALPLFSAGTQNALLISTIRTSGTVDFNQLFDFNFN